MTTQDPSGPPPVGSRPWWDDYFRAGGGWETNQGRRQTRTFAEAFCRRVPLPQDTEFSLLDVGCALGEAIRVFSRHYPRARFTGMDVSEVAIARCREEMGAIARFQQGPMERIAEHYDVIYCSNVLEHFRDYRERARFLARWCGRLCILVPFNEFGGEVTDPRPDRQHQVNLTAPSFDFLVAEGLAQGVSTHVFAAPGVWSYTWRQRVKELYLKNPLRRALGKNLARDQLQIIFDIVVARAAD